MNRRAALIATGALAALTLPLASPAAAAPPARGCPPVFELLSYRQQVDLAMQLLGLSEADAEALADETVALIDKNGDRALCFAFQNKHTGEPNVIDNAARSRT
jgi:hypothetical protein